jgi:hypothetical protein
MLQGLQQKRFATLQVGLYTGVLLQVGKNSEFQDLDALPRCLLLPEYLDGNQRLATGQLRLSLERSRSQPLPSLDRKLWVTSLRYTHSSSFATRE